MVQQPVHSMMPMHPGTQRGATNSLLVGAVAFTSHIQQQAARLVSFYEVSSVKTLQCWHDPLMLTSEKARFFLLHHFCLIIQQYAYKNQRSLAFRPGNQRTSARKRT